LISWIFERPYDVSQWNYIFRSFIDWPVSIFFLSAAGYISGIYYVIKNRFSTARERPRGDVLLLIIGITFYLFYPFMPFSGTSFSPDAELAIPLRYLILPFTIGVVLFARVMDKSSRFGLFWFWLAVCAIALRWGLRIDKLVLAAVAVMMIKTVSMFWDRYSKVYLFVPVRKITIFVLLPGVLVGLLVFFPYQKNLTDKRIFEYGGKVSPRGEGWRALEQLPDGASIAAYGTIWFYPNFGRRLQFRFIKVNEDGTKNMPFHVWWKPKPKSVVPWSKKIPSFLSPKLIDNLVSSGVDYVLTSKSQYGKWPVQHNGLAASGKVEKVFDDGYSVIWKLPVCNKF